jgi:hypothetical protein
MAQPGAADMTGVNSPDATAANMRATDMTAAEMPATDVAAAKMTATVEMAAAKVAAAAEVAPAMAAATVAATAVATTAARQGAGRQTQHPKGDAHQEHACCDHREFSCRHGIGARARAGSCAESMSVVEPIFARLPRLARTCANISGHEAARAYRDLTQHDDLLFSRRSA